MKNRKTKILIFFTILLLALAISIFIVSDKFKANQELNIPEDGYTLVIDDNVLGANDVAKILADDEIVDSEFFTKMYIRLNSDSVQTIHSGSYLLMPGDELSDVFLKLSVKQERAQITLQILEGYTIPDYANDIATLMFNNGSIDDIEAAEKVILDYWSNHDVLNGYISEYDFITDEILNSEIYYPLEGYLSPNSYFFFSDEFNLDNLDIITEKLLDAREKDFEVIFAETSNEDIGMTYHEILTLASIVERESVGYESQQVVAGIFMNRIDAGDSLGSDVTTYYAVQIGLHERDLTVDELNDDNAYNTRGPLIGLPVSAINNPSRTSIDATINYVESDYYYFVSDKNGDMYYNVTYQEHLDDIEMLKSKGLWYTYE